MKQYSLKENTYHFVLKDRATQKYLTVGYEEQFPVGEESPEIVYGTFDIHHLSEGIIATDKLIEIFFDNGLLLGRFFKLHRETNVGDYFADNKLYSINNYYFAEVDVLNVDSIKDHQISKRIKQLDIKLCDYEELLSTFSYDKILKSLLSKDRFLSQL